MTLLPRSLYTRLTIQMLGILGASAIGLVVASGLFARQAVDAAYDRLLVGSVMQLAEGTWQQNGAVMV
ncbi:MAG: sensor histidine kinase, partial [Janthinobacterium lividum]